MELVIGLVLVIAVLTVLDLAALKWGQNSRQSHSQNERFKGGYDPRYEWNSSNNL